MTRKLYILLCLAFVVLAATAQTDRQYIRKGNAAFAAKKYGEAEVNYRKALAANGQNAIAAYDLGCAMQAQHKDSLAIQNYTLATENEANKVRRASAFHNLGTVFQGKKDYQKAVEAYKNALRNNPKHTNARYNLTQCMRLLKKQQQQQQQNKQQQKDDKKDKNKNKNNDKNKQQNPQDKKKEDDGMSKDNAEQMLNAAMQEEKATLERLKEHMKQSPSRHLEKNW
ncbi:tetratricopeptide repeat protein [Prevotella intermedia]|uniref:tetratricopeptide repeat protein n=1 Tax=Prevotella intermedia TaxID=28131 RepID=UPI002006C5D4|nr:tetratricopeptide repeat protein [Prevotella intermedia]MCK6144431.1 tetratricopeptide repeat protein [Prevotella intermedia]